MANLFREAALYPVRDAATSIEHISLDEVKKRRGCKGRRRGFREGGGPTLPGTTSHIRRL